MGGARGLYLRAPLLLTKIIGTEYYKLSLPSLSHTSHGTSHPVSLFINPFLSLVRQVAGSVNSFERLTSNDLIKLFKRMTLHYEPFQIIHDRRTRTSPK